MVEVPGSSPGRSIASVLKDFKIFRYILIVIKLNSVNMPKGKSKKPKKDKQQMKTIVRVLGTDLDGDKDVFHAILKIKGISHSFSNAICKSAKIDPKKKLGSFTESEIAELEKAIKGPLEMGVSTWLLNRRKNIEDGKNLHVSGADVEVSEKFDIQRMVDKKTYKGVRHMFGLPVRGQRTRSSFRRGKTVGVVRKSVRLAAGITQKKEKK
jgi:small subunit ribosomal protein S13